MLPVFSSPIVTIIDCGATRTAVGVFKLAEGRLRCVHFAMAPFPVRPAGEDNWFENTAAAMLILGAGRRWSVPAVLLLPAHLTLTKQIKAPLVGRAKREKIIRFEAEQAIPHALTEVEWDGVLSGQRDATEDIMLVAVKREITDQLCAAAQTAGFRPGRILPSSLATLAGFRLARPSLAQPTLVLNLGGRSTTLLQVEGDRFAARTLALGAGVVIQQLAENQGGHPGKAERMEHAERNAGPMTDAIETLAGRLAQEMSRSVLHFGRQCGLAQPELVYLTGGGARLAGLAGMLAARLKLPVESFAATEAVGFSGENTADPALTDLIGAASIMLRPPQPAMDLLPPGLRQRENLRRRQPWLIAAALLVLAALGPPILHYRQVALTARTKISGMEEALAPLRARELRNRANLARLEKIKAEMGRLESVHARRTGWLRLLAGLEERLVRVEDVWLEKLQLMPPAENGPLKLAVSGRMLARPGADAPAGPAGFTRVKELLAGLAGLPSVAGVEGERFDPSQPGLLRFDFVLVTDPAHPL